MKKYIPYILVLVVGFVIGILCRPNHFRDATDMVQRDTIVRLDTIRYSRLELTKNTCKLDIPKINNPRMVLIPADSATIIYRDSIRYVTFPRQYFFTSTDDVEIWHSGIDSTIDSLNVVVKTAEITKTAQAKVKKNHIGIGVEAGFLNSPYIPIYLEYERMLHRNASFYARVLYDLPRQSYGVEAGAKFSIGW